MPPSPDARCPLPLDRLRAIEPPQCLADLELSASARILFLAPHPDDFDAAGVTLQRFLQRGNDIRLAVLTGGAAGVSDAFVTPATDEHKNAIREQEQKDALAFFGLPLDHVRFGRLAVAEDGELPDDDARRRAVEEMLGEIDPDVVLLPHGDDTNPGHRRTWALFRRFAAASAKPLLALYLKDPKTVRIRVDLYTPFGAEDANWKRTLLLHHRSQHARNLQTRGAGFDERILGVNRALAVDLGIGEDFAEGFEFELFLPQRA